MVGQSGKEGLVDGAASELLGKRVVSEHIEDRVGLTLCEESVSELNVVLDVVNARFTAVGNDEVVIG